MRRLLIGKVKTAVTMKLRGWMQSLRVRLEGRGKKRDSREGREVEQKTELEEKPGHQRRTSNGRRGGGGGTDSCLSKGACVDRWLVKSVSLTEQCN